MNNAEVLITFRGDGKDVENTTKDIEKELEKLKVEGALALAGITTALDKMALSFAKGGIAYDAQIETYLTRLETLTGSAEKANEVLEQIKKDALTTPFDVSSLTQAESLLLSTGMSAEQARDDILALGNAVSASGGGNAELQRMAINLQQIKNYGKASALDVRQFTAAGIPIYQMLADATGKTTEELKDMDITYEILSEALQKASSEGGRFYGAMEKQSKTYNGAMSNLNESLDVLKGEVMRDLFKALKKILPVVTKLFDWLGKHYKLVKAIAVPLLVFFNLLMGFFVISKLITIIAGIGAVIAALPFALPIAAIGAIIALIVVLWNNCEWFRDGVKAAFTIIVNVFKLAFELIKGYIYLFIESIEAILNAVEWIKGQIREKIDAVVDFFTGIPDAISDVPGDIEAFFQDLPANFEEIGRLCMEGLKTGMKKSWKFLTLPTGEVTKVASGISGFFRNMLGIHSPSTVFAELGKYSAEGYAVGFQENMEKSSKILQSSLANSFDLSPTLTGTASSHLSNNVNVVVNNNMKTDPLGQVVNKVKTFSGGAKNDYNYGYGG